MRPIDADALVAKLKFCNCTDCNNYNIRCRMCPIDAAIRAIENAPTIQAWNSTKDQKPSDQRPVTVYVPQHTDHDGNQNYGYVGTAYYTDSANGGYWAGTDGNVYGAIGIIHDPTHWMELPEPPRSDVE